jgi:hypothetical protein
MVTKIGALGKEGCIVAVRETSHLQSLYVQIEDPNTTLIPSPDNLHASGNCETGLIVEIGD